MNRRHLLLTPELFSDGGIQQFARDTLSALSTATDALDVWTLCDETVPPQFVLPRNVSVRCASGSRPRFIGWALEAAVSSCRDLSVTVMHTHLAPVALPLRLRGAAVRVVLVGVEVWHRLTPPERLALAHANSLISISGYTADRFRHANPEFAAAPISVCPLGVGPTLYADSVPDDPMAALIVSRLSSEDRYKGHDALLRAWVDVRRRVSDARLIIAGDGDDRPRLQELARSLDVDEAVRFVGHVSRRELEAWYRRCSFFVLPSTNEGFGLVFLEAMRAGKACIGCAGAASEIITSDTGVVLPDQDVDTLADAIVQLFSEPALREHLGRAGYARWRETFTSEHFGARFRALTTTARGKAA